MFGLSYRMLKDKFFTVMVYIISGLAFLEMYISMFPSAQKQAESMKEIIKSYEPMLKAMNLDPSTLTYEYLESFLATEMYSFLFPILSIIFVTSLANYSLAGEIEKGNIELTLAQPVSRIKIFFARYFTAAFYLLLLTASIVFAVVPLAKFHNISYSFENYVTTFVASYLFALAIMSFAFFASSLFSERGKSSFLVGGSVILMYVINVISALKENLKDIQYFSIFHYYNASSIVVKNTYVDYSILYFLGVTIVFTALGAYIFNKRDIAV